MQTSQFFAISAMDVVHIDTYTHLVRLSTSSVPKALLCLQRFWALQSVVLGIGLSHVMLTVPRVLNTVAPEGKSTAATMLYITKEGLRNWKPV